VRAIVVGAGVIGASIGLELARAGYQVTIVDRASAPGLGSTSASSAIVRYHYPDINEATLAWECFPRWCRWEDYLGARDPAGMATFIQSGLVIVNGELIDLSASLQNMSDLGIEVERLTADDLALRFPSLERAQLGPPTRPEDPRFWADSDRVVDAYWMPQAGFVDDPQLAAHNLAHAAGALGVRFRYGTEVVRVLRDGAHVAGVGLSDGNTIVAPIVVNAAGPWSGELNRLADVLADFTTTTRPLEQEVVTLAAPAGFRLHDGGVCVTDADLGTYFRPHFGNTLVVGGMEPPCDPLIWLDRPEQARLAPSQATWDTQTLRVARRLPGLGVPGRSNGIVGVYDVTDDWIPIYDRTCLGGFYVAIGTSGHGFKQAPFVGELMARLITACEAGHPHDIEPVRAAATWTSHSVDLGHFSRRRRVTPQHGMG
jgi:sarcosine oxidase, subunit beta